MIGSYHEPIYGGGTVRERGRLRKLVVEMTDVEFERFEESAEVKGTTVKGLAYMLVAEHLAGQVES